MKKNIILIGMPGSGKSTVGVLLAKSLGFDFLDTDLIIQKNNGRRLQEIISDRGLDAFFKEESKALFSVRAQSETVISTGGSAVFCEEAMEYLKKNGRVVYLETAVETLEKRIRNIKTRGIAAASGETISDIYNGRKAYYEKYADFTVKCKGTVEELVEKVIDILRKSTM